jgi:hypothetical protein
MRRGLLKVALADDVKASSSERSERHVVEVRYPALVKQARLENFRVMCINDGTVGLLEIATEVLKHPYLHFEPRLHIIVLHHLVEGRSNLGDLAFAKCSDSGVEPAFVIARGRKRDTPFVPYFAIAANLNDCVYALMRESRETVLFE